jgi:hypothetical protein
MHRYALISLFIFLCAGLGAAEKDGEKHADKDKDKDPMVAAMNELPDKARNAAQKQIGKGKVTDVKAKDGDKHKRWVITFEDKEKKEHKIEVTDQGSVATIDDKPKEGDKDNKDKILKP